MGIKIAQLGGQKIAMAESSDPLRIAICSAAIARDALQLLPELRRMLGSGSGQFRLLDLEQSDPIFPTGVRLELIVGQDGIDRGPRKAHDIGPEKDTRPSGVQPIARKVDRLRSGSSDPK